MIDTIEEYKLTEWKVDEDRYFYEINLSSSY